MYPGDLRRGPDEKQALHRGADILRPPASRVRHSGSRDLPQSPGHWGIGKITFPVRLNPGFPMVLILFFDPFLPKNWTLHSKDSTKIMLAIQDGLSRFFSGNAEQECDIEELPERVWAGSPRRPDGFFPVIFSFFFRESLFEPCGWVLGSGSIECKWIV